MEPFFFGEVDYPLFGVFHPAAAQRDRRSAVLICNGLNHDYLRSHRQVHQLAQRLCRAGFSVLRFDYPGNGDSWGASSDPGVAQWTDSIGQAMDELEGRSAAQSLNLLSIRAGALFADNADLADFSIDQHLSVDPVIDGASYRQRLQAAHRAMLVDPMRFGHRRNGHYVNPDHCELLGTEYAQGFCEDLAQLVTQPKPNISVISTKSSFKWPEFRVAKTLPVTASWEQAEILESQLVLPGLIDAVEQLL